jgi:hypothetical protein
MRRSNTPGKVTAAALRMVLVTVVLMCTLPSYGQDAIPESDDWEFTFTSYLWLPSINADSTISNINTSVELSVRDIVDNFDDIFGIAGRFEIWDDRLGFLLDGFYVTASGDFQITRPILDVEADVDIGLTLIQGSFSYRTDKMPLGSGGGWPAIWFEPFVGLRFTDLTQDIEVKVSGRGPLGLRFGRDLGGSKFFLDPVLGVGIPFQVMEKLAMTVRGDVGGFGVGSDLSSICYAGIDYRPWKMASFQAGYQGYYLDYESTIRTGDFGFKGWQHGPWLGISFHF